MLTKSLQALNKHEDIKRESIWIKFKLSSFYGLSGLKVDMFLSSFKFDIPYSYIKYFFI